MDIEDSRGGVVSFVMFKSKSSTKTNVIMSFAKTEEQF